METCEGIYRHQIVRKREYYILQYKAVLVGNLLQMFWWRKQFLKTLNATFLNLIYLNINHAGVGIEMLNHGLWKSVIRTKRDKTVK